MKRAHRALKGARIVFKGHEALIDCTVSNLSDRAPTSKWTHRKSAVARPHHPVVNFPAYRSPKEILIVVRDI
jgi:hypothetical protein